MSKPEFRISEVKIRFANDPRDGLIGWVSCVVNDGLYLNNIAIFRNADGTYRTEYPAKKGRNERLYFHFCPINRETRALIDDAVLAHIRK